MAAEMTQNFQIEARGIRKAYGKKQVLADVSFFAESGQCVGILGGNGSGKSTLFSILSGVRRADGGSFFTGRRIFCVIREESPISSAMCPRRIL